MLNVFTKFYRKEHFGDDLLTLKEQCMNQDYERMQEDYRKQNEVGTQTEMEVKEWSRVLYVNTFVDHLKHRLRTMAMVTGRRDRNSSSRR